MAKKYTFAALPGYFADFASLAESLPSSGVAVGTQPAIGLLDRSYDSDGRLPADAPRWARFAQHVEEMNLGAGEGVSYKVLYLIRHGMGVHNLVSRNVGHDAWENKYSKLETDGTLHWADAELVDAGREQARALSEVWLGAADKGIPLPSTVYTSPLTRCLQTTQIVFSPLYASLGLPLRPVVKELLREQLLDHPCDRRGSRSSIVQRFPGYVVEEGFSEEDLLWSKDAAQTAAECAEMKHRALEDIWEAEGKGGVWLALSTHSLAMMGLMTAVGLEPVKVREGSMVAVLVRGEKVKDT